MLAKANPLEEHHFRTAVSSLGCPSTRETLTDWSESCKGQKDGALGLARIGLIFTSSQEGTRHAPCGWGAWASGIWW